MARKAYAIANDGMTGLMFKSKALRDFFVSHVGYLEKTTYAMYHSIERKYHNTYDMSIPEFWDGEWDLYDEAHEQGLI